MSLEKKMQTSAEWWEETKKDPAKLNYWLQRQCYGEFEAFKFMSDDDEIVIAKIDHEAGLQALGLVI